MKRKKLTSQRKTNTFRLFLQAISDKPERESYLVSPTSYPGSSASTVSNLGAFQQNKHTSNTRAGIKTKKQKQLF